LAQNWDWIFWRYFAKIGFVNSILRYLTENVPERIPSLREELFNSVSHGVGALLSVAGLAVLVILASRYGTTTQLVSFSIYGASLIILYAASTLYHSVQDPRIKDYCNIIDHSAIFLLIAGTYTPFLLVAITGVWGWTLLVIVWGLAVTGIGLKTFYFNHFKRFSLLFYILMGWLVVVFIGELVATVPRGGLTLLAVGGVTYTVGTIFYALKNIPYSHGIWHLFVLVGSLCHFLAIFYYLAPPVS
jgi:hemolysin III